MERQHYILGTIGLVIIVVLIALIFGVQKKEAEISNLFKPFVQCIADSDAIFFGASWCSRCAEQKALFGALAKDLPYVECSKDGTPQGGNTEICTEEYITSYPTWRFTDGEQCLGVVSLEILAAKTNCSLPNKDEDATALSFYNKFVYDPAKESLARQVQHGSSTPREVAETLLNYDREIRDSYQQFSGKTIEETEDPYEIIKFIASRVCSSTEEHKKNEAERLRQIEENQAALEASQGQ